MDWGVPDWTSPQAYGDELTTTQWWWEFTRRHPDYRALWLEHLPAHQIAIERDMEALRSLAVGMGDDPDRYVEYRRNHIRSAGKLVRDRFKATCLMNPAVVFHLEQLRGFVHHDGVGAVSYGRMEAVEEDQERGYVLIRFNLDKPLEEQIDFARDYLSDMQKHEKGRAIFRRPRKSNWPLFLRALDARDACATFDQMAETFWPGQSKTAQSARDTYVAACQLRDNFPI